MKSGTSSLRDYLRDHPEVFIPPEEELHYFVEGINWKQGLDWYRARFADAGDAIAVGEKSPTYTMHPEHPGVPERIAALLPEVRLIYVVRHPIERIKSHYVHQFERGQEGLSDQPGGARRPALPGHHPVRDAARPVPRLVPGGADHGRDLRPARPRPQRHVRPDRVLLRRRSRRRGARARRALPRVERQAGARRPHRSPAHHPGAPQGGRGAPRARSGRRSAPAPGGSSAPRTSPSTRRSSGG